VVAQDATATARPETKGTPTIRGSSLPENALAGADAPRTGSHDPSVFCTITLDKA
jgi:hypothetical protein